MIKRDVGFTVTPQEIANEFAAMGSSDQAQFFNALALRDFWPMQLHYVAEDRELTAAARGLMRLIGEYGALKEAT